jgi:hypothetical protein
MSNADPTMESLQKLSPDNFRVVRRVPIFIPHHRSFADGSEVLVTEADLPEIAAGMQERERESGVVCRVTDGHIDPSAPEADQPELVGFARNATVGRFGPRQRPAILADLYIRRDRAKILSQRPYRSAEYYPGRKEIRGLALLLRDPQLDMGILYYSKEMKFYGVPVMPKTDDATLPDNATMPDDMNPDTGSAPDDDDTSPEEAAQFERCFRYMMKKYGNPKGWMQRYEESTPAGSNTTVPGMDDDDDDDDKNPPDTMPMKASSRSDSPLVYQLQTQVKQLIAERDRERAERDRERVERVLDQVEISYEIDRKAELARMLKLTPQQREERLREIRRYHPQVPGTGMIRVYSGSVEGNNPDRPLSKEEMKRALQYQRDERISWEDAVLKARQPAAN